MINYGEINYAATVLADMAHEEYDVMTDWVSGQVAAVKYRRDWQENVNYHGRHEIMIFMEDGWRIHIDFNGKITVMCDDGERILFTRQKACALVSAIAKDYTIVDSNGEQYW